MNEIEIEELFRKSGVRFVPGVLTWKQAEERVSQMKQEKEDRAKEMGYSSEKNRMDEEKHLKKLGKEICMLCKSKGIQILSFDIDWDTEYESIGLIIYTYPFELEKCKSFLNEKLFYIPSRTTPVKVLVDKPLLGRAL